MKQLLGELETLAATGAVVPEKISIKDNIATIQCVCIGAGMEKLKAKLSSEAGASITIEPSDAQTLRFTLREPKTECKGLLKALAGKIHELEAKLAADKKARRKRPKL
jgi:hypothetical protein